MERRLLGIRDERFRRARESLAERLNDVCAQLPPEEREALFDRMANIQIKYMMRANVASLDGDDMSLFRREGSRTGTQDVE